jgi:hypothetical protein
MSLKVSIKGHGASIAIEVFGYENLSAQNASDANWLNCRVVVDMGQFVGNYDASFTTSDFIRFRNELKTLQNTMRGSASFVTDEEALNCTIEMRATGTALVKGTARVHGHTTATLSFSFESDQSFLAEALREVEAAVCEFPLKMIS